MPRKQRFKPSRKPKPIITAQADGADGNDGNVSLRGSSAQRTDMPRTPEVNPSSPAPADVQVGAQGNQGEARSSPTPGPGFEA
jgi:hypothetical protein